MRIVIELRRDVNPSVVLNLLYKHTQMQDTFGVINLALVDNQPKILNLYELLNYYLIHQKEVITRRTRFDLNKAEERAHILQGLIIALDNIDEVISIIRGSRTTADAKNSPDGAVWIIRCTGTGYCRYASEDPDRFGT